MSWNAQTVGETLIWINRKSGWQGHLCGTPTPRAASKAEAVPAVAIDREETFRLALSPRGGNLRSANMQ